MEFEDGIFLCRALHDPFEFLVLGMDDDFVAFEDGWTVFGQARDVDFV